MWWRVAVFVVLCLHPVSAEPTLAQTAGYPPSTATDILRSQRAAIERNSTDTIDNGARSGVGTIIFASFEKYIPFIIALALWLLSIFLFYEGIEFHQITQGLSFLSRRTIVETVLFFIYSGVIVLFYQLLLVSMTTGWPNIKQPGKMVIAILLINPEIYVPVLLILSFYPSVSAMLRYGSRDHRTPKSTLDNNGTVRKTFAAMSGFFLSLTIFVASIAFLVVFVVLHFSWCS